MKDFLIKLFFFLLLVLVIAVLVLPFTAEAQWGAATGSVSSATIIASSQPNATDSVGLKRYSTSVVRFSSHDIQTLVMGADANASPFPVVLRTTNGFGTDIPGASITFAGGQGTGTGAGGDLIFQTALAGGTGSSLNALNTRFRISQSGNIGIGTNNYGTSALRVIALVNGTAPTSTVANQFMLTSVSGEPQFRSGAGLVSTVANAYGALFITNGAVVPAISAANTWLKVTGFTAEAAPAASGCTVVADSITVTTAGTYKVSVSVSLNDAAVTNNDYKFAVMNDQTVDTQYQGEADVMTTAGNVNIAFFGIYTAAAAGDFSLVIRNVDDGDDPVITQCHIIVERLN